MKKEPRVLVVANNSFSLTSSNGRALGNLFIGWDRTALAEFCISSDGPNFALCNNYYCITDYAAIKSCLSFKEAESIDLKTQINIRNNNVGASGKIKKTAFKVIVRNLAWMTSAWRGKNFWSWVDTFNPDLVLVQNTDSAFMLKIAYDVSKRTNTPLVFYNTEGHYFFDTPYTSGSFGDRFFYGIYRRLYTKLFRKVFNTARMVIHCNTLLKKDFDAAFSVPSHVIYISSFLNPSTHTFNSHEPVFSYLGDFLNGRAPVLVELGSILNSINPNYKLDIYGNGTPEDINLFQSTDYVDYKGFVSYEDVVTIMDNSDILFHVESQDKKWYEPLRYGFSAKIADTISMGKPFIQYSSSHNAGAKYLQETKAGWFVDNKTDLKNIIKDVINNESLRDEQHDNALKTAHLNHDAAKNRSEFKSLLISVLN